MDNELKRLFWYVDDLGYVRVTKKAFEFYLVNESPIFMQTAIDHNSKVRNS